MNLGLPIVSPDYEFTRPNKIAHLFYMHHFEIGKGGAPSPIPTTIYT
ncbi:hypothetical protein VCR14J2_240173 [Vibrio coralliirubri]|nr:hypothetical protein VCR14J2_240173 [Vibrio coralliirubri]